MFPKTPQTNTRSAGTAPSYALGIEASPVMTSTPPKAAFLAASLAISAFRGSSSTRRALYVRGSRMIDKDAQ